ncbi:hypothetical protein C8Q75DRAFT_810488 [Abortiporus biennis]|nr:hypothetical protein C8Q75DRAFT_810488 [Abortiporus biennis]
MASSLQSKFSRKSSKTIQCAHCGLYMSRYLARKHETMYMKDAPASPSWAHSSSLPTSPITPQHHHTPTLSNSYVCDENRDHQSLFSSDAEMTDVRPPNFLADDETEDVPHTPNHDHDQVSASQNRYKASVEDYESSFESGSDSESDNMEEVAADWERNMEELDVEDEIKAYYESVLADLELGVELEAETLPSVDDLSPETMASLHVFAYKLKAHLTVEDYEDLSFAFPTKPTPPPLDEAHATTRKLFHH